MISRLSTGQSYDPGREVDLVVTVDEQAFGAVILGPARFSDALAREQIRLEGPPALVREFPTWIGQSRFAKYAAGGPALVAAPPG